MSEFYRVEYGGNQYSVPYTHIHLHVDLKVTQSTIHVFYEREKIAEHAINQGIRQDICLDEHISPAHRAQKGLSKDEIIFWANRTGPNTAQYVCYVLNQKRDLARNIKSLNKLRKWVVDNQKSHCLEEACDFASQRQIYALDRLQRIIANNAYQIQQHPLSDALNSHISTPHHNIRGADYYFRNSGVAHA